MSRNGFAIIEFVTVMAVLLAATGLVVAVFVNAMPRPLPWYGWGIAALIPPGCAALIGVVGTLIERGEKKSESDGKS